MGWTDDQGYQRVPGFRNYPKSYLRGGRTTKNTNGYLVFKNYPKSYLQGGRTTKDANGYLVLEIVLSPTYGVDGQP